MTKPSKRSDPDNLFPSTIVPILTSRRSDPRYDPEQWRLYEFALGRSLQNLSDEQLLERLFAIEKNIAFLDPGSTSRDDLPADRGWISPWWWLRARYCTVIEIERRGLGFQAQEIDRTAPPIGDEFIGVLDAGQRLLTRVSELCWLEDSLGRGAFRFTPASYYEEATLDAARADDEMKKSYFRPARSITIQGERGPIKPIGDVEFSASRIFRDGSGSEIFPYWTCCFSDRVDPRLFDEFASISPENDACLVIFDPDEFARQALPHLNQSVPTMSKDLFPIDYYDPHFPPEGKLLATRHKRFEFAYQREMRFALDPEGRDAPPAEEPIFIEIGSIESFAGLYRRDGEKVAGSGPKSFYKREP
jgi:hypothetical protein